MSSDSLIVADPTASNSNVDRAASLAPPQSAVEALFQPLFSAFPLARAELELARSTVLLRYPPPVVTVPSGPAADGDDLVPDVINLRIVDPAGRLPDLPMTDGMIVSATRLAASASIVTDVTPSRSCAVAFEFDGVVVRTESSPPYAIAGDDGKKPLPWTGLTSGPHTLKVTPFVPALSPAPGGSATQGSPQTPGSIPTEAFPGRAGRPVFLRFLVDQPAVVVQPESVDPTDYPLAAGARRIFVRPDGDDGNAGDSPTRPLRSISRAVSLLRPAAGDRLMLCAGQTFTGPIGSWRFSGQPGRPAGIFAYDPQSGSGSASLAPVTTADRPVIAVRDANAIDFDQAGVHDVAFVGIRLTAADRDPASTSFNPASRSVYGIQAVRPTRNVLIDDCQIDHFAYNVSFVSAGLKGLHQNLVIRRCLILDAWGPANELFKGQGLYLESCNGLRVIECLFDHNGWIENAPGVAATRNIYRHAVYVNERQTSDMVLEGNCFSGSANFGVQVRNGGVLRNNVFLDNATCVGIGGESGVVSDNLFVGGHDTASYEQAIAVEIFSRKAVIERNLLLCADDGQPHPYPSARLLITQRQWTAPGLRSVLLADNTLLGCHGPALGCDAALAELTLHNNAFRQVRRQVIAMNKLCKSFSAVGNAYEGVPTTTFSHVGAGAKKLSLTEWSARTGDNSVAPTTDLTSRGWTPPDGYVAGLRARGWGRWPSIVSPAALVEQARAALASAKA